MNKKKIQFNFKAGKLILICAFVFASELSGAVPVFSDGIESAAGKSSGVSYGGGAGRDFRRPQNDFQAVA